MDGASLSRRETGGEVIEILTRSFERVLRRSKIDLNDDFFDLGGDSILAVALALEIERATGTALPPTALFEAPTIASLAPLVMTATADPCAIVVPLKPGTAAPPLFIAHGVGGTAFELVPLARRLETAHAVYGLQAPGLDGRVPPLDSIEALARFHLGVIRGVQPKGPYLLAGYSMGGFVAFEMAQQLARAGEPVAQLILLDTLMPPRQFSVAGRLRIWSRRTRLHARVMKTLPVRETVPYLVGRLRGFANDFRPSSGLRRPSSGTVIALPDAARRVRAAGVVANTAYRPRPYQGAVTFIEAARNEGILSYPDITWGRLVKDLSVHPIAANHWTMMTTDVDKLGDAFSQCLLKTTDPL